MSIKKNKKTSDAVGILHRRYIKDNPGRKVYLQQERIHAQVAQLIYDLRKKAGLSQKQLAEMVGTTQSVISRLEDSDYDGHSLSMLERITKTLDKQLKIEVVEIEKDMTQQGTKVLEM
jgi:ribosome-binding protein aMBF1 (putative translation factor)